MAILVRGIRDGIEYEGFELEYILDEDMDLGEVYLDEKLIFQSDEVYTEKQLQQDFKTQFRVEDLPDDLVGFAESQIDYNIEGVSTGLYTRGGEYMTQKGTEYIGDYHVHADGTAMQGKFMMEGHSDASADLSVLEPMEEEDVILARETGVTQNIDYTVDADVYPFLGVDRDPIELTDDELLEEQRQEADIKRFGIIESDRFSDDEGDFDSGRKPNEREY